MRTMWMGTGLVLAFALACGGMPESTTPTDPVVVTPDPQPERGEAGDRRGKSPAKAGKTPGDAPPDPYVAEGACPGECCAYNKVVAHGEETLYGGPKGRRIGDVKRDEVFQALTGEVHVHPVVATVKHAYTLKSEQGDEKVAPGDEIWVLDPTSEGRGRVWHDGGVYDAEVSFAWTDDCDDGEPADLCWAVAEERPDPIVWWVKVERKDGTIGWVDNSNDVLKGFDGCGTGPRRRR